MPLGAQALPLTPSLQVFIEKLALSLLVCNLPSFIISAGSFHSSNLAHHYMEILSSNDSNSMY